MAKIVLTNVYAAMHGYDISGDLNAIAVDYGADPIEDTVFGQNTHTFRGGLKLIDTSLSGLVDEAVAAPQFFSEMGASDRPFLLAPDGGEDGDLAFAFNAMSQQFQPGGQVGEMYAFSHVGRAQGDFVRGTVMLQSTGLTSSGNGTARQLGSVASGEQLFAGLHVFAAGTGTIDVTIESDATNSFSGAETTRITFAQASGITSEWATPVNGAITDEWWRVVYTIAGGAPSFDGAVFIGIQ